MARTADDVHKSVECANSAPSLSGLRGIFEVGRGNGGICDLATAAKGSAMGPRPHRLGSQLSLTGDPRESSSSESICLDPCMISRQVTDRFYCSRERFQIEMKPSERGSYHHLINHTIRTCASNLEPIAALLLKMLLGSARRSPVERANTRPRSLLASRNRRVASAKHVP